ncbi:PepSY-associated TM helix domain-containing protein [Noviherbaspirillum sp.]|uniref:PepSY-associated TM helix domain-containing protein n=1 Tax=Noviherbaspirillum sp. TaxID=1926288 RepID=UPI002D618CBE|nr:PepSY-associated TM helix domain-containing protein [Noviherbaspirillum sp.]HZW23448.1 PepSY-associated TM helix domain-containing protein [Noviherbaspirillum sp.]
MKADAFTRSIDTATDASPETDARVRKRSRRAIFLTWLRKTHLYVGLWGAVLGLLFGVTGFLLNHRAIMKIPVEKTVQRTAQVALPGHSFGKPEELSAWLQQELNFAPAAPPVIKTQPAKAVVWADREVMQPERWTVTLTRPERGVTAEYFVGNRFVKLDQVDATPIGTLTRLHMSIGVNAFWVLLSDTIAGGMILLSITGLLLWTQLHTVRTIAVLTSVGALVGAIFFMWSV